MERMPFNETIKKIRKVKTHAYASIPCNGEPYETKPRIRFEIQNFQVRVWGDSKKICGERMIQSQFVLWYNVLMITSNNFPERRNWSERVFLWTTCWWGPDEVKKEIPSLLKLGGYRVTKWRANVNFTETYDFGDLEQQSVLGLCCNLVDDTLFYKLK